MTTLQVSVRHRYGNVDYVLAPEHRESLIMSRVVKKESLNPEQVALLKQIGFEFEVLQEKVTL